MNNKVDPGYDNTTGCSIGYYEIKIFLLSK